eukprot:scaffold933_cov190-Alexandrium_tamarense.AAC.38
MIGRCMYRFNVRILQDTNAIDSSTMRWCMYRPLLRQSTLRRLHINRYDQAVYYHRCLLTLLLLSVQRGSKVVVLCCFETVVLMLDESPVSGFLRRAWRDIVPTWE